MKVPLAVNPLGWRERLAAIRVICGDRLTQGSKVREFENKFAELAGRYHAVMVNSGSSANLLAMRTLRDFDVLKRGDEVFTNAVTYSTSVSPIVDVGCVPVFVDSLSQYDVFTLFEDVPDASVSLVVNLLGYPSICPKIWSTVVEDCCELPVGRAGRLSHLATYSFYFSHHICTIEGGMVVTDNEQYANHLRKLREFGSTFPVDGRRFIFTELGYNFRATELQGAIGLEQLPKLPKFVKHRQRNVEFWNSRLNKYDDVIGLPHSYQYDFRYPVILRKDAPFVREEFTKYLESHGIETRPIMAGNITEQPVAKLIPGEGRCRFKYRTIGGLPNARWIHRNGFLWGNHTGIGAREREYVADVAEDFLKSKVKR